MSADDIDVLCIGNAIVDVLSRCAEGDIDRLGLVRGAMTLIEADRVQDLYQQMGPAVEASGGSASNTAALAETFSPRKAIGASQ